MSKKLEKLKEVEAETTLKEIGLSSIGDIGRISAKLKRKSISEEHFDLPPTNSRDSKAISVYTKKEKIKKEIDESDNFKKGSLKFEKEIGGKKHTIDKDFLQQFGITLD